MKLESTELVEFSEIASGMDRFLLECSPANSLATMLLDAELIERSTWLKSTRKRIVARFPLTVLALL